MTFQKVKIKQACPTCGGEGSVQWDNPPTPPLSCPSCSGTGKIVTGEFKLEINEDGHLVVDE